MIDDHAHPFALEYAPLRLAEVSLDVRDSAADRTRRAELAGSRLSIELLGVMLARYLGCAPADAADERNARARAGWPGWVAGLIADCGITGLILPSRTIWQRPMPSLSTKGRNAMMRSRHMIWPLITQ